MASDLLKWPERLFERFLIVGLSRTENAERLARDIVNHKLHHPLAQRSFAPEILYSREPSGQCSTTDVSNDFVKAFCFPVGVVPDVIMLPSQEAAHINLMAAFDRDLTQVPLQKSIFLLKAEGISTFPHYGLCCYLKDFVQGRSCVEPPGEEETQGVITYLEYGPYAVRAPRCYCFLSHYPFVDLHFQVLDMLIQVDIEYQRQRLLQAVSSLLIPATMPRSSSPQVDGGSSPQSPLAGMQMLSRRSSGFPAEAVLASLEDVPSKPRAPSAGSTMGQISAEHVTAADRGALSLPRAPSAPAGPSSTITVEVDLSVGMDRHHASQRSEDPRSSRHLGNAIDHVPPMAKASSVPTSPRSAMVTFPKEVLGKAQKLFRSSASTLPQAYGSEVDHRLAGGDGPSSTPGNHLASWREAVKRLSRAWGSNSHLREHTDGETANNPYVTQFMKYVQGQVDRHKLSIDIPRRRTDSCVPSDSSDWAGIGGQPVRPPCISLPGNRPRGGPKTEQAIDIKSTIEEVDGEGLATPTEQDAATVLTETEGSDNPADGRCSLEAGARGSAAAAASSYPEGGSDEKGEQPVVEPCKALSVQGGGPEGTPDTLLLSEARGSALEEGASPPGPSLQPILRRCPVGSTSGHPSQLPGEQDSRTPTGWGIVDLVDGASERVTGSSISLSGRLPPSLDPDRPPPSFSEWAHYAEGENNPGSSPLLSCKTSSKNSFTSSINSYTSAKTEATDRVGLSPRGGDDQRTDQVSPRSPSGLSLSMFVPQHLSTASSLSTSASSVELMTQGSMVIHLSPTTTPRSNSMRSKSPLGSPRNSHRIIHCTNLGQDAKVELPLGHQEAPFSQPVSLLLTSTCPRLSPQGSTRLAPPDTEDSSASGVLPNFPPAVRTSRSRCTSPRFGTSPRPLSPTLGVLQTQFSLSSPYHLDALAALLEAPSQGDLPLLREDLGELLEVIVKAYAAIRADEFYPCTSTLVFAPDPALGSITYHRPPQPCEKRAQLFPVVGLHHDVLSYAEEEFQQEVRLWSITQLCRVLSLEHILQLLKSLLLEERVVVLCSDLGVLSSCVLAMACLLQPFTWQNLWLPVTPMTPMQLREGTCVLGTMLLQAVFPFILGIPCNDEETLFAMTSEEYREELQEKQAEWLVVRLLDDEVRVSKQALPPLPNAKRLKEDLQGHYELLGGGAHTKSHHGKGVLHGFPTTAPASVDAEVRVLGTVSCGDPAHPTANMETSEGHRGRRPGGSAAKEGNEHEGHHRRAVSLVPSDLPINWREEGARGSRPLSSRKLRAGTCFMRPSSSQSLHRDATRSSGGGTSGGTSDEPLTGLVKLDTNSVPLTGHSRDNSWSHVIVPSSEPRHANKGKWREVMRHRKSQSLDQLPSCFSPKSSSPSGSFDGSEGLFTAINEASPGGEGPLLPPLQGSTPRHYLTHLEQEAAAHFLTVVQRYIFDLIDQAPPASTPSSTGANSRTVSPSPRPPPTSLMTHTLRRLRASLGLEDDKIPFMKEFKQTRMYDVYCNNVAS